MLKTIEQSEEAKKFHHFLSLFKPRKERFIHWFDELQNTDVGLVGGKNASLGEMFQSLKSKGVEVPFGFAVSSFAYFYNLEANSINREIRNALNGLNVDDIADLQRRGAAVRQIILSKRFPSDLEDAIASAYGSLESIYGVDVDVAVRSSATAEDLPDASFAGQQETFLNIRGKDALIDAARNCMASLFTNRAISYRVSKNFDHFSVGLSIGVQVMVRSDLACSGVMFSLDTESGFADVIVINGSYGLGENIVQGAVNPDDWIVFKPLLNTHPFQPILKKRLGAKEQTLIYAEAATGKSTKNIPTPLAKQRQYCLTDDEVLLLSRWACIIEDHYTLKKGSACPMDMEWAKDGKTGQLFIVQARPETVHSQKLNRRTIETYVLKGDDPSKLTHLCSGSSVGTKIGSGRASVMHSVADEMDSFIAGSVLVTEMTDPDWEPILKRASAVVTNRGGRTCHAAIISRELGIPCLVGCEDATLRIASGQYITVDCTAPRGVVYNGTIEFEVQSLELDTIPKPETKICLLLANPDAAFQQSFLPNDGVGLARMEFIVSSWIKVHPLALLHPEKLTPDVRVAVSKIIGNGSGSNVSFTAQVGSDYFVENLSEGLGMIAAAFYPKPVILRFSDFKTDEYANLLGGRQFEPIEDNPMIGWRGCSRYYDAGYSEGFALECKAAKFVRERLGLTNLWVMVPFVRTTGELLDVYKEMEKNGLKRGEPKGAPLKHIMMCEVPSNAILATEFLDLCDGFSIGSNDLTQLTLGIDRNSHAVARLFDERNPAVKKLISGVISEANALGKYIGICGQAPSDYPEFCQFLVECGIGSISVQLDRIVATHILVFEAEQKRKE